MNFSADFAHGDADGMNNWQEWRCQTDPTNALSALRLLPASPAGTNVTVSWQNERDADAGVVRLKAAVGEAAVAQICNLLYRGFPIRTALKAARPARCSTRCRMQFGDTAD